MKKIGLVVKEISENRIRKHIKESDSFFVVKYSGLSSPDLSALRRSLRGIKTNMFVVKNTVAKRALKERGLDSMINHVEGPCGFIFMKEEPVESSKLLCAFAKDHENLKLSAGFLKDKLLEKKDIEALSKLPSKEVSRAQVVCALKSPLSGIVMVLNSTLKKFVICLEQIKQKKQSNK